MRQSIRFLFASFGLLLPAYRVQSSEEARALVDRAMQASGGETKLRQARAVHTKLKGILHEVGNVPFTGEDWSQAPGKSKLNIQFESGDQKTVLTQVFDGTNGWVRINDVLENGDLEEMKLDAYVNEVASLLPLREKSYSLEMLPDTKVQDRPARAIKVTSKDRPDVLLYFDSPSGLLCKVQYGNPDRPSKKGTIYEQFLSDYREVHPTNADEQLLKDARIGSDSAALLQFLRKRTADDAERAKIKSLVDKLGDNAFEVREDAKKALVAAGVKAAGPLRQATRHTDTEVRSAAKECLQQIQAETNLLRAVLRLLAKSKPPGAAEVLLAYLPSAPDETVAAEANAALAVVAFHNGKPDPAVERALKDNDSLRREAATVTLLGEGKTPFLKYPMKGQHYRNGAKVMEWEVTEVEFFAGFEDKVFARP
jgi:hypothetical protein